MIASAARFNPPRDQGTKGPRDQGGVVHGSIFVARAEEATYASFLAGNKNSFWHLFRLVHPRLLDHLQAAFGFDRNDAEEVAQQTWHDFLSRRSYRLCRVGSRLRRLADANAERHLAKLVFADAFIEPLPADLAEDRQRPSPLDEIQDALLHLDGDTRAAVVLYYFGQFTAPEIAAQLCLSRQTVMLRLQAGLDTLRSLLREEGGAK